MILVSKTFKFFHDNLGIRIDMKYKRIIFVTLIFLILVFPTSINAKEKKKAVVLRVIDGDTLDIRLENGRIETIRLIGVDTPEIYIKNNPQEFEGIEDPEYLRKWGRKASNFTKKLEGKRILLETDKETGDRGSYGRLLAYVHWNDEMVNKVLLKEGYARVYDSNFKYKSKFSSLQRQAKENGRGLWSRSDLDIPIRSFSVVIILSLIILLLFKE